MLTRLYRFDDVEIDVQGFRLLKAGEPVQVEPKTLNLLLFLIENRGRLLHRREVIDTVWSGAFVTDHVLNRAVGQIRKALSDDAKQPRYIETVPTLGYRFIAEVEVSEGRSGTPTPPPAAEGGPAANPHESGATRSDRAARFSRRVLACSAGALLIAICGAAFWMAKRDAALPTPVRSLAVLPLKNLSGDASQDYVADGMTDQIITDLGQIAALRVISPETARQYKDARKSLPQIAQDLDVDVVVTGSVARSGDRLRIDAQLFDAPADKQLWAHSYEGEFRDAFNLQNQVATAVADQIRIKVTPQERAQLSASRQTNPDAYEALLKGYFFDHGSETPESSQKAMAYFKKAAELDPSFARAYVGIARSYNFLADGDTLTVGEATAGADASIAKALELDPKLAEAYSERGWTRMFFHWDMPGAAKDFEHAIELDPGDPSFYAGYGYYLLAMGRFDEALQATKHARDLDPLSIRNITGYCQQLMTTKHYGEALAQCKAALELDPNDQNSLGAAAELYEETGAYAEAHPLMKKAGWCDSDLCTAAVDELHGAPGKAGACDAWLKTQKQPPNALVLSYIYALLGRKDDAFANMEKAYEERQGPKNMVFWGVDPNLDKLHSDPRFDAFLKHAGLPPRPKTGTEMQ